MKAYMICDYTDDKAASIEGTPNIGIEYMGNCGGRLISEDGKILGCHHSSSFGWLRSDLRGKVVAGNYEIIDLIGKELPLEICDMLEEISND